MKDNLLSNLKSKIGPAKDVAKSRAKVSPQVAKMQFPTSERAYYGMMFKFNNITYDLKPGSKAKFSNLTDGAHIFLPLPASGIIENMGINYNAQEVGAVMQLVNTGANAAEMIKDNLSGAPAPGVNRALVEEMGGNVTGAAALALRKLANEVVPGVGAIIDMKTGSVVNPYTLALFQSVGARPHNFTFRLIPRNQSDSNMIREIVRQFQYHSLPSRKNNLFLTMPSEVEMAFYGTDKLFKFAPSVITNVSVNYSPFGAPSFFGRDNAPTGVELTLSFMEIEALTRESYEDDGTRDAFNLPSADPGQ